MHTEDSTGKLLPKVGEKESYGTFKKEKTDTFQLKGDRFFAVMCVVVTLLCERLAYVSLSANLILFCTSILHMDSGYATTVSLVFTGTTSFAPVIGGYIADSVAGRFNTILGASFIYILGMFLVPASGLDYEAVFGVQGDGTWYGLSDEWKMAFFLVGLALIIIGIGGMQSNLGPFGAQQVRDLGPSTVQTFFNWYYWFGCVGSLVALIIVAYVEQEVSFVVGYGIAFGSIVVATVVLVASRNRYIHISPSGSVMADTLGVCRQAKCWTFDTAREKNGGSHSEAMVDGVLAVLRILPVFFFVVFFMASFAQMQSTYYLQSERMDLRVRNFQLPATMVNAFHIIAVMPLVPVLDRVVYPFLKKIRKHPSELQRIGFGLFVASLSVFVAGGVEILRKQQLTGSADHRQVLGRETFNASSMSVFWQIPQFVLTGFGSAFVFIPGMEFAFSQAPEFMQGLVMGLFIMTNGFGSYLSEVLLIAVQVSTESDSWFPNEMNNGKAENFFFLLGGIVFLSFLLFIPVAKCYKYKRILDQEYEVTDRREGEETQLTNSDNILQIEADDNDIRDISL
ncbi:hypothetical protein ScPMuIL_004489 [Solemya velum]